MEYLISVGAIILTALVVYLISRRSSGTGSVSTEIPNDYDQVKAQLNALIPEKASLEGRYNELVKENTRLLQELNEERDAHLKAENRIAESLEKFRSQEEKINNQKKEIEELHDKLSKEFENIANRVLRQSTEVVSQQNKERLETTLKPLGEKIKSFEEKIEKSGQEREGLKEQIKLLHDLNKTMAEEAKNLTHALKGDSKKRGNWGEIILERILEDSGLVKGQEYETEYSTENIEGSRVRPDVIIRLPEEKHIIVDSKVSLNAYEAYASAEKKEEQEQKLKMHLDSVRLHVRQLSEKSYQSSREFNTPDFVLMFMPIEAAFSAAIQNDTDLFSYAWDKKIVIVSPTTLLATLKTIASIWKQERQNKNALEIARQSGALYDKFVGFIDDLKNIEKHIDKTKESYEKAWNKLSEGRGNLITSAEKIKKLGAKTSKQIEGDLSPEESESSIDED